MPEFSLLSLNTFGVPFYLSGRRIKQLTAEIIALAPSVICLQEIQQHAYLPLLRRGLPAYAHHAYFRHRYAPKGGLFTASILACPITRREFIPFPHRGDWFSIGFADWALNKGVLLVNLDVQGRQVIVMNTHLQANYAGNWQPTNRQTQIQLAQVNALAEFVHRQPPDAWIVVCGDFNFPRQTLAYRELIAQSGLIDPLADDPRPTYRPFALISSKWVLPLDYVLYRLPQGEAGSVSADIIPVVNSKARRPFQRFLTDHHALSLSFR